jgi:ATP-binding cassette subfamily C protein
MRVIITFIKAYPWRTGFALLAVLFAGIADGASISALLPLLKIATGGSVVSGTDAAATGTHHGHSGIESIIINALASVGLEATLGVLLVVVVIGVTIRSILLLVSERHVGYSAAYIGADMRLALLRSVLATRWDYFLHQPIGRLTNSLSSEANRASKTYESGVTMMALFIQALIYLAISLSMSWKATLACFGIGIIILSISHSLVIMAKKAGKRQTKLYKSLVTRLTDILQSVKSLKAMAREDLADSVVRTDTARLNRAQQRDVLSGALLNAVQPPLIVLLAAIGIYIAIERMGISFASITVLVILLSRVIGQMGKLQKQYQKMVTTESAYWSLHHTIKEAENAREVLGGWAQPRLESAIRLEHVSFSYAHKPVLRDVSLTIPARSLTTVIGTSGAGKTTMIDLIIGLNKPDSGAIYLDETPLSEVDLKRWRRMIGYVPQEHLLLHGSILMNVTFGDTQLTEADAEQALKAAGAWEFVSELPLGMHTNVGERGATLSGGQRQRIMIARALAHRPALLILDEPTSALDPANEALISQTLQRLRNDYTLLAISHQTALVKSADVVFRLQDGRISPVMEKKDTPGIE